MARELRCATTSSRRHSVVAAGHVWRAGRRGRVGSRPWTQCGRAQRVRKRHACATRGPACTCRDVQNDGKTTEPAAVGHARREYTHDYWVATFVTATPLSAPRTRPGPADGPRAVACGSHTLTKSRDDDAPGTRYLYSDQRRDMRRESLLQEGGALRLNHRSQPPKCKHAQGPTTLRPVRRESACL